MTSRLWGAAGLTLSCVLGFGSKGLAQTDDLIPPLPRVRAAMDRPAHSGRFDPRDAEFSQAVAEASASQLVESAVPLLASRQLRMPQAPPSRRGVRARQVTGGVIGGILGLWAGAEVGAALEGDSCDCDSPGFKGVLFGAPVGAAIGAVLGVFLAGK